MTFQSALRRPWRTEDRPQAKATRILRRRYNPTAQDSSSAALRRNDKRRTRVLVCDRLHVRSFTTVRGGGELTRLPRWRGRNKQFRVKGQPADENAAKLTVLAARSDPAVLRQPLPRMQARSFFATLLMFSRHPGLTPLGLGLRLTSTEPGPGGKPRSGLRFGGSSSRGTEFFSCGDRS